MKINVYILSILFLAILINTPFAEAKVKMKLTHEPCFPGNEMGRLENAKAIVKGILKVPAGEEVQGPLQQILDQGEERHFLSAISIVMRQSSCGFTKNAKFETTDETIQSLANEAYKVSESNRIPSWLRAGFYAKISADENDNSIFVETTSVGFIFHRCIADTAGSLNAQAPPATPDCPLLGNKALFTPVEEMISDTNGPKSRIIEVLKALAGTSIIVSSGMQSWGLFASLGQTAVNFFNPTPLPTFQRNHRIRIAVRDLLKMGAIDDQGSKTRFVVRTIPGKYQDLEDAVSDTRHSIFAKEFKRLKEIDEDPYDVNAMISNPALTIEINSKSSAIKDLEKWKADKLKGAPAASAPADDDKN